MLVDKELIGNMRLNRTKTQQNLISIFSNKLRSQGTSLRSMMVSVKFLVLGGESGKELFTEQTNRLGENTRPRDNS